MTVTPSQFIATAKSLGDGCRYVLNTTGPTAYDCSGLVYRTLVNLEIYSGTRFSTRSWAALSSKIAFAVPSPAVGDIVLWAGHMGIVDGPDTFYSAYSPSRGVLDTSISKFARTPGFPRYYRLNAYAAATTISVGSHSGVPVPVNIYTPTPVPVPVPAPTIPAPPLPEDDDMKLIRITEDGRIMLVGVHNFERVPTPARTAALVKILGPYTEVNIREAQAIHDQVNDNIIAFVGSLKPRL